MLLLRCSPSAVIAHALAHRRVVVVAKVLGQEFPAEGYERKHTIRSAGWEVIVGLAHGASHGHMNSSIKYDGSSRVHVSRRVSRGLRPLMLQVMLEVDTNSRITASRTLGKSRRATGVLRQYQKRDRKSATTSISNGAGKNVSLAHSTKGLKVPIKKRDIYFERDISRQRGPGTDMRIN